MIPVPPLAMVDDIASIAACNIVAALTCNIKTDSFIQRTKSESQVGDGKCIHVGNGTCKSRNVVEGNPTTQAETYKHLEDHTGSSFSVKGCIGDRHTRPC